MELTHFVSVIHCLRWERVRADPKVTPENGREEKSEGYPDILSIKSDTMWRVETRAL